MTSNLMVKYVFYTIGCATGAVICLFLSWPIWTLLVVLAMYFGYRVRHPPRVMALDEPLVRPPHVQKGVVDHYRVEAGDEEWYGLYTVVDGRAVFIDILEDHAREDRVSYAIFLHENRATLTAAIHDLRARNSIYRDRVIQLLTIHEESPRRGEIIWAPSGVSLLAELSFDER